MYLGIGIITLAIVGVIMYYTTQKDKKSKYISFKESLDLTNLPIVTFTHKDLGKLNLLIDTGSTVSLLDRAVFKDNLKRQESSIHAGNGTIDHFGTVELSLSLKDNQFLGNFDIVDMGNTFKAIKEDTGVTLHGIIGSPFMDKYNYIIDFKEYIIYAK